MEFITLRHILGRASSLQINPQHGLEVIGILNHGDLCQIDTEEDCDRMIAYAQQRKTQLRKLQILENDQALKEAQPSFEDALQGFIDNVNAKRKDYYTSDEWGKDFWGTHAHPVTIKKGGRKYVKLVQKGSVFCFIEKATGHIFKPASYSAPAKHARGSIYKDNGNQAISYNGTSINYLK